MPPGERAERRRHLADRLVPLLEEGEQLGFLGSLPVDDQIEHSLGFARVVADALGRPPTSLLDLGSGGGLPGLVLAALWPATPCGLLEANQRRARFLERALVELGVGASTEVLVGRAETLARGARREAFEVVTARSFGPPAVTAECGAPFAAVGGWLVVSEPPTAEEGTRWPLPALGPLGISSERLVRVDDRFGYRLLQKSGPTDPRFPRRVGVPGKRPLF